MNAEMITEMSLKTKHKSFDMYLMDEKSVTDLDIAKILDAIDRINRHRQIPLERDALTFLRKFELIQ